VIFVQNASCAAQCSCWKFLEIAALDAAAAAFAAYSQLKRKFDMAAAHNGSDSAITQCE
jgi:hypothetical protein